MTINEEIQEENKKIEKYNEEEEKINEGEREIEKEFGYELVERIGRFLFLLYKKGIELEKRRGNRWVYVDSSKICNGILSSRYIEIIKRLRKLKVIDIKYGVGKFGKKKEKAHIAQVGTYKRLLEKMNFKKVSAFILYGKLDEIVEV